METLYKKYTLEEAEQAIRDLVEKSIIFNDTSKKLLGEYHKKYPIADPLDEIKEAKEAFDNWNKNCGNNIYQEELWNLTKYNTPIRNDKKCCKNCFYIFCHLNNNGYKYCDRYKPSHWEEEILYYKAVYGDIKEPSLEERIENETRNYLNAYKRLLKHCSLMENKIPKRITTQPFSQQELEKETEYQKRQREWWKDYNDTFDKEKIKFADTDLCLYKWKPNKEKSKIFANKWGIKI